MSDSKPWEDYAAPVAPVAPTVDGADQEPWKAYSSQPEAPAQAKGFGGHARDLGLSLAKSVVAVPEALVGLADIPTGGAAGKALENEGGLLGFRPKQAKDYLSQFHTDQYKEQQQQFADAEGLVDKAGVALSNPSLIANVVAESAAPLLAGGVAARGAKLLAPALSPAAAGAIGEGAVMAGSQAEGIRQETSDGLLTAGQSAAALATGALGSLFGYAGGRLAQKLGIGDVDTLLARGITPQQVADDLAQTPAKSLPRQVIEGAISEGFLEELPQSVSEQIIQNLALDRPWAEGTDEAAVMGTLAGMAMGGPAAAIGRQTPAAQSQAQPAANPNLPDPAAGPLSAAANLLPAPSIAGALPAPDTLYVDPQGNASDAGPTINVDGARQRSPQSQPWVSPANNPARSFGPGMDQQAPSGPLSGALLKARGQALPEARRLPQTIEGEVVRQGALPDLREEALLVDAEGNAQPGRRPNTPPPRYSQGGPGMDQPTPLGQRYANPLQARRAIEQAGASDRLEVVRGADGQAEVQAKAGFAEADAGPRPILQNRDRSTPASVVQMQRIAASPDYGRLGFSRDFANGAPVIEPGADIPSARLGKVDYAVTGNGRRIPVQYAVVEASDLLPSHNADGSGNAEYADGLEGMSRAIAGNGRVAGLQRAYRGGSIGTYPQGIQGDSALHGIPPSALAGLRQPVLVRVMPKGEVTADIGDESNTVGVSALSAAEQARNDAARIDVAALSFGENGEVTEATVRQFVQAMPAAEQGGLLDGGVPSRQARDRLDSAIFAAAYESHELIRLHAQATDPEARTVLTGLLTAAPAMARLKGAGQWDIRGLVVEAAEAAVNARRQGRRLDEFAQQADLDRSPETQPLLDMFAASIRSAKQIGDALSNLADLFYSEASKPDQDMFGAVPKRGRQELLGVSNASTEGQPANPPAAGDAIRAEAAPRSDAGPGNERPGQGDAAATAQPDFGLNSYTEQELAEQARQRDQAAATEAAQAKAEADRAQADKDRNDFTLTGSDRSADVGAARGQNDLFAPPTRGEKKAAEQQAATPDYRDLTAAEVPGVLADAGERGHAELLKAILDLKRLRPDLKAVVDDEFASIASFYEDAPGVLGILAKAAAKKRDGTQAKAELLARGDLSGLILASRNGKQFAFFLPDASEPGRFRASYFDAKGFFGHSTRDSYAQLLDEAFTDGYRTEAPDALQELAGTEAFAEGNALVARVQAVNAGRMSWAEFMGADSSTLDAAAHQAATSPRNDLPEPSDAQKEAGNYAKGHIKVQGLDITVENPRGSERRGVDPDGNEWRHTMSDHYGYIKRTEGADGEQVDVYVGTEPEATRVFIVDQLDQQSGGFDEHKVMLGFDSKAEAITAYRSNFDAGWKVGPVTDMGVDAFKRWLKDGDTTQPARQSIGIAAGQFDPGQLPQNAIVEDAEGNAWWVMRGRHDWLMAKPVTEGQKPEPSLQGATRFNLRDGDRLEASERRGPLYATGQVLDFNSLAFRPAEEVAAERATPAEPATRTARTASDISDAELKTITEAARYLKDFAYSTANIVDDARVLVTLSSALGKSGRDNLLMQAFNIDRDLAHTINNRLDDRSPHKLREQDMEEAYSLFPGLRALVDKAVGERAAPGASDSRAERRKLPPTVERQFHTALHTLNEAEFSLQSAVRARGSSSEAVAGLIEELRPSVMKAHAKLAQIRELAEPKGISFAKLLAETEGYPDLSVYGLGAPSETLAADGVRTMDEDGRPVDRQPIKPGDVFRTSSGRTTTPYPKQKGLKYSSQWLIDNATAEAEARGDSFNAPTFRATTLMKDGAPTQADSAALTLYLFGEQPAVLRPFTRPLVESAAPAGIAEQLASLDLDALAAMIDSVSEAQAAPQTSKPQAQRSSKAKTAEGKPRVRAKTSKAEATNPQDPAAVTRTAKEIAKSLGGNLSSASLNALEGLTQLFGGPGKLSSGLSFDEESYAKAKPLFRQVMNDLQAAGKDLRDLLVALVSAYGDGVKPYILRFAQDLKEEQSGERTDQGMEPNRPGDEEPGVEANLRNDQPGAGRPGASDLGAATAGQRSAAAAGLRDDGAAAGGERGNSPVGESQPAVGGRAAGGADSRRGRPSSTGGLHAERETDGAADGAAAHAVTSPPKANVKASDKPATLAEIREQLPFLTEGQAADVVFAEQRLMQPEGYGVLYTNGTGTGKTFSGLGIVARSVARGKDSILVVTPKQTINDAWVKAGAQFFGLDIKNLESTRDNGGSGVVVTTYANLSANASLARREWDAVVLDEAHYLSSDEEGSATLALKNLRALTKRRGHASALVDLREREKVKRLRSLTRSIDAERKEISDSGGNSTVDLRQLQRDEAERDALLKELDALRKQEEAAFAAMQPADKPRGVFLSATPFAYDKNIVWAQQFLFDWGPPVTDRPLSYNEPGPYESFMVQHFGYRMRYNKLTQPDAKVDSGLMERAFNAWLRTEGVLSARALESEFDYDRLFVTVESPIGRRVDEALKWLRDQGNSPEGVETEAQKAKRERFRKLDEKITKGSFGYHARMYFLEAIKAREALPHIRAQLAKGRKVLVMHDFKKGGTGNPFRLDVAELVGEANGERVDLRQEYAEFRQAFADLIDAFDHLPSPITQLTQAFPDALVYNGDLDPKPRLKLQDQFNSEADDSPRLMIAQGDAMREGVSIHDTSGKFQRVMVHLGMPVKPTAAIQQEGRTYRTGQASHALFRYFTIGTAWERYAFASKIAKRAGTAENLAMGEQARGLQESFIDAYEAADLYEPGFDGEGTGGKARDLAAAAVLTPWDQAKSFYYGVKQQGSGRGARGREGADYFATPEPVGLKLVEWADIRRGEDVLEPSAGHGAIARWLPDGVKARAIEPSAELASRLSLRVDGDVVQSTFEEHHIVNKYDAVVMNPPFGQGGSLAIQHLAKAAEHLREHGRVVALIPTGPAADKRFDNWFYAQDKNGNNQHPDLYLVADVQLPSVTFERAGTAVRTRVVVIDKLPKGESLQRSARQIDLSNIESVDELFNRLENLGLPARSKPVIDEEEAQTAPSKSVPDKTPRTPKAPKQSFAEKRAAELGADKLLETDAPIIEHTTGRGKLLRGVIVQGRDLADIQATLDPAAFRKNGGVFVREQYIKRPADAPRYRLNEAPTKGLPLIAARGVASKLAQHVGLRVEVVADESGLPEAIQASNRRNRVVGRVAGVYHQGTAYLVASNLRDAQHAASVILHEAIGHGGVRAVLGSRLGDTMQAIYRDMPAALRASLERRYAGQLAGLSVPDAQTLVAEEYVAHLAETDPQHSLIERLVAQLRALLRRLLGEAASLKWTRNDLVQLLAEARQAARRGESGVASDRYATNDEQVAELIEVEELDEQALIAQLTDERAFARAAYRAQGTGSPFFRRWFGNSRMIDRQGQPLAFYHRSFGEKVRFDDSRLGGSTGTGTALLGHFLARRDVGNVERYGPAVERFYVRMEKPKVITQDQFEAMGDWTSAQIQAYRQTQMQRGHDGLYIQGLGWPVVFEGKNIKAARNSGTFDDSDSVRYALNRITDSAAFKRWFGGSKVVDANGEPLVVHHGTSGDFSTFDGGMLGASTGHKTTRLGFFTTTSQSVPDMFVRPRPGSAAERESVARANRLERKLVEAAGFDSIYAMTPHTPERKAIHEAVNAERSASNFADGANVMPLYLSIQNPLTLTVDEWMKATGGAITAASDEAIDAIAARIKAGKHDGLMIQSAGAGELDGVTWVAFSPEQIKSAIGNSGAFDPDNADIRYSLTDDAETAEALRKLGLGGKAADSLLERLGATNLADLKAKLGEWATRSKEGLFDGLAGIQAAEEAVGVSDPNQQGYVSARLATGLADVMHAVLHYGAPEWRGGVVSGKAGTRGVLDILGDLGTDNLTAWLGWLGGKRAQLLKAQGRENNLGEQDIAELLAMAKGKEALFEKVYQEYAKTNEAVLDLAQEAGLIDPGQREKWTTAYYVPFYRQLEGDGLFSAPRSKRGLSHQTAAIRALKGGKLPTQDLLANMLASWTKRIDASLKNKALLEVVGNLKDSEYLQDESLRFQQVLVSRSQIAARIRKDRKGLALVANMLGLKDGATAIQVVGELMKPENKGFEKLWTQVAPTDPDIIRVQRGGKNEYYRVTDQALLRGLKFIEGSTFNDPITRIGRTFKRLLTTGVTASPDFILRNFVRDAAHAWMINKDGFAFASDSLKGMRAALAEDQDYMDMMFAGASFQGGYVHATDPEASAQVIRRALEKKGFTAAQRDAFMGSLVDTPAKAASMLKQGWQKYRELGDKVENANRLATYKAALAAGKSRRQAAFESKDLMDYSMRGNFAAAQWLTDVVPFLNARAQGLYKLGRAVKGDKTLLAKEVALKGGYIALFSLLLAGLNDDDERYQALQDWDKDMYWHIWLSKDQVQPFRIPKPFELGLLFGTVPERMLHALTGSQGGSDLTKAVAHGVFQTLAFNPVPQFYQPIRELQANRNFFRDQPIEDMSDEGKLPEARYDERTSALGVGLGQLTGPTLGLSPKQLDSLIVGYTGTLGGYVLSMSNLIAGIGSDVARPSATAADIPVVKVLYQGDAVKTSRYQAEFYDMMQEADQLYRTVRGYRQEGRTEEANALQADNRAKLRHRPALGLARQQLAAIRRQMDAVQRNPQLDGDAKRTRLDELQRRANTIAERITERAKEDF